MKTSEHRYHGISGVPGIFGIKDLVVTKKNMRIQQPRYHGISGIPGIFGIKHHAITKKRENSTAQTSWYY